MTDDAMPHGAIWRYPAILACLGDGRKPDRREVHLLAGRILREYQGRLGKPGFAALRRILLLTRITLNGSSGK